MARSIADVSDPTWAVTRRILRGSIARVTISVSRDGAHVRAMPDGFHPLVAQRRDAAFAKAGASVSIAEAQAINDKAMEAVATANGSTILAALNDLAAQLKAADAR